MSAGSRYAKKVRTAKTAVTPADPEARAYIAAMLADFQSECDARSDQTTFEADDRHGRVQAFREGKRQACLYLQRLLNITSEEIHAVAAELDHAEELELAGAAEAELTRRMNFGR